MTLKTSINAKQIMFYSSSKTDFCVNLFIPSEKETAMPHSLALNRQHCFDARDRHQREAGNRFKCGDF